MVRLSNSIIALLNLATFVISIPILGGGIWLATKADTDCEKFLQWPLIIIGGCLMFVSLVGLVGACCKVPFLLWVYLFLMFLLILLLLCFTIFAFLVTNKGAGKYVSGKGYKEYRLGDYSNWMRTRVGKASNWRRIKSCLHDAKLCKKLADKSVNEPAEDFFKKKLSPTQSGCCKPPTSCGFTYVNATYWSPSTAAMKTSSPDCVTWSNNQEKLCYDCSSCKAGVLANLKHHWRRIAIVDIVVLVGLIMVYSIGCCAFRNIRRDENHGQDGFKGQL